MLNALSISNSEEEEESGYPHPMYLVTSIITISCELFIVVLVNNTFE